MPLPDPVERDALHARDIEMRGFRRRDGLWEVEGRLRDVKTRDLPLRPPGATVPAGDSVHDIRVRLTFDEHMVVHDALASFDARPYATCEGAAPNLQALRGARMSAGWRKEIQARLGHERGCTHIREMLPALATVAYQTLGGQLARRLDESVDGAPPKRLDSCYAYGRGREVVKLRWPQWYVAPVGPDDAAD